MRDFDLQDPDGVGSSYPPLLLGLLRFLSLLWCLHPPKEANRKVAPLHDQREGPGPMIATAAVQLLHEYTGRGPTKAKTLINDEVVTVLLADTLTKAERKLVDAGRSDRVLQVRHDYQLMIRDELIATVERQLERRVIAFMSQNHIDPDLAVEVFVLEHDRADERRAGRPSP